MNRTQLQRLGKVQYENFNDLPKHLRATYVSWRYGFPIELKKSQFYIHRKALLAYGIDISIPNNVQTMPIKVKTIELAALTAPDWYIKKYA